MKQPRFRNRYVLTQTEELAWVEVEKHLRKSKAQAPGRGFSRRWVMRWQITEERSQRARSAWLAVANAAAALVLLLLLIASLEPIYGQPTAFIASIVNLLVGVITFVAILFEVVASLLAAVPLLVWLMFSSALLTTLALSTLFLRRLVTVQGE